MDTDTRIKLAVYRHFAETGMGPAAGDVAERTGMELPEVYDAYSRLRAARLLVLEPDGRSIRMAPPFSGVPTQHVAVVDGRRYFANCAWDALGVPAALRRPGEVRSHCEQSGEPLRLMVGDDGPEDPKSSGWLFHCLVPAAKWWDDIVFT